MRKKKDSGEKEEREKEDEEAVEDAVSANKNRLMSGYSSDIFGYKNGVRYKSDCSCPLTI